MPALKDLKNKKYILLDLDGTLYRGKELFTYSKKFIRHLKERGKKMIIFTNNSSKSTAQYASDLRKRGLDVKNSEIYTSGRATIEYLQKKGINYIYLIATPGTAREFRNAGFTFYKPGKKLPQAVVLTFDETFTYKKFCIGHDLITAGIPYYATHPDSHVPLEGGKLHPDIGAFIAAFRLSTGKNPIILGKPKSPIYKQLMKHYKCKKEEIAVIGDRLNTDIKGAKSNNILSILVFSGETDRNILRKSRIKPDLTAKDLEELIQYL
jgi:4-nitrophenyl phosphatase